MQRKLILHGSLKQHAPDGLSLDADTVVQAINGLCKVLNLQVDIFKGRTPVKILGHETLESVVKPLEDDDVVLHIIPAFAGAKDSGGLIKIVIGALLIVAAVVVGLTNPFGQFLASAGLSLIVGGLIQVLFPTNLADRNAANYLGAPGNTTAIGTRIALAFGRNVQIYGQFISYNTDALAT